MSADIYVDMVIRDYREIQSKLGTNQETTASLVRSVVLARIGDARIETASRNSAELVSAVYSLLGACRHK